MSLRFLWDSIIFLPFSILLYTAINPIKSITYIQTDNGLQESLQSGLRNIQITSDCHILQNFLQTARNDIGQKITHVLYPLSHIYAMNHGV